MDIKMLVVTLPAEMQLASWCRKLGISRQTAYKWRRRFAEQGLAGLEERSRAPKRPHGRVPSEIEEAVVRARKQLGDEGLDNGPASVKERLRVGGVAPPSETTIWRILVRRGQVTPSPAKRPKVTYRRFQRDRPNECWQGDDTHYLLSSDQEVRIINIIDDHSRYNAFSLAVANCTSVRVWEAFCRAAERLGLPTEFLNDNGRAYTNRVDEAPVLFQAHLVRLGVRQIRSRFHHPQTCGKVERFHQTQRRWLDAQPKAASVAELQELLDRFGHIYNHQRPHRALGRRRPAQVWAAQPPACPAGSFDQVATRITAARVNATGTVPVGRYLTIHVGMEWVHHHITVIRRGLEATLISTTTGEIVRELVIDPNKTNQASGRPRGKRQVRRPV